MKRPIKSALGLCLALAAQPLLAADEETGPRITKCQDAQGRWHYGDTAAEECAASRVTTIDAQGVTVEEEAAPDELAQRRRQQEQQKEQAKAEAAQRSEDERLLATYESEAAIIAARDQRLAWLKSAMESNADMVARLKERLPNAQGDNATAIQTQIADFEKATASYIRQRADVEERYGRDLARYRELRHGAAAAPTR